MNKINSQKGFVIPLVIAIVVILIGGGIYLSTKKSEVKNVEVNTNATTTQTVNSDWKTLTSTYKDMNFTIQYPATWSVQTSNRDESILKILSPDRSSVVLSPTVDNCQASAGWSGSQGESSIKIVCLKDKLSLTAIVTALSTKSTAEQIMSTFTFTTNTTVNNPGEPIPSITSISPATASIGTTVELKGTHFSGFEGDRYAWIENSVGQKGIITTYPIDATDSLIRFKLNDKYCTVDTSYSGLPCPSHLNIVPGTYSVYVFPWGNMSNKMTLKITN